MDVIEGIREYPLVFQIVDFESHVRGHEGGHVGAQIYAEDFGGGESFGEVDAPDSAAGANIEDALRRGEWGEVELSRVYYVHHGMH